MNLLKKFVFHFVYVALILLFLEAILSESSPLPNRLYGVAAASGVLTAYFAERHKKKGIWIVFWGYIGTLAFGLLFSIIIGPIRYAIHM
jgi:hypothetical protein